MNNIYLNIHQTISNINWQKEFPKLVAIANIYIEQGIKSKKRAILPDGLTAPDIVCEAIEKTLNGERTWDQDKYPDFLKFLAYSVIKSLVDSSLKKVKKQLNPISDLIQYDKDGYANGPEIINKQNIESTIIAKESENQLIQLISTDDPEASLILNLMLEGKSNLQIASDLGIDIQRVEAAKKRVKRRAEKILKK